MARTLKWKQKAHNGGLGSEKTSNLVSAAFLSEGEKLLGGQLHSPSLFKPLRAGGARPGELTPFLKKKIVFFKKKGILTSLHALDCVRHATLL